MGSSIETNLTRQYSASALMGVFLAFVILNGAADLLGQEATEGEIPRLIGQLKDEHTAHDAYERLMSIGPECVLHLVRAYRSDPDARVGTWLVMMRIGPDAAPPLVKALKSGNPQVREDAAAGLGLLATHGYIAGLNLTADPEIEVLPALIEALKDESERVRMHAVNAIRSAGPDALEALPALLDMLKAHNCTPCEEVVNAVGALGPRARPAVERLSKHDSKIVRTRTAAALRKIRVFELIEQLKERDNRGANIMALAEMGSDAVDPILHVFEKGWTPFEGMGTPGPDISVPAGLALQRIGKEAVPPLLAALEGDNALLRCIAAGSLGRLGGFAESAENALAEGADVDEYVRQIYEGIKLEDVLELKAILVDQVVPALMIALRDVDEQLRRSATSALGYIGPPAREALPALFEMFTSDGDVDRHGMSFALVRIGVEAVPGLKEALRHENAQVVSWAADALGRIGQEAKEASPALIEALEDDDVYVRVGAADALTRVGGDSKQAMLVLIAALDDDDYSVRHAAMRTLRSRGSEAKEAVSALAAIMKGADIVDRISAAEALGGIGPDAAGAVPGLIIALRDNNTTLRMKAATALGKIGPKAKEAVPALVTTLNDDGWWMRTASARALGEIGPDAKSALPALNKALGDENEHVRKAAGEAVKKLSPSNEGK